MELGRIHSIYFLGIGGIGMSALARYFKAKGKQVGGYDRTKTQLTEQLENEGINVHYEENTDLIPENTGLVVYTPAVPSSNKEFVCLQERNIPFLKRSEVLGLITAGAFTIAIAGTHGKTTVSSIVTHIFKTAGIPVNAFVGGIMKNYNTNIVHDDKPQVIIVEADEYDRSFLRLNPDIAVITSIDADHLDIYQNRNELVNNFSAFINKIKPGGTLLLNEKLKTGNNYNLTVFQYGLEDNTIFRAWEIRYSRLTEKFNMALLSDIVKDVTLEIPGVHNIENCMAAAAISWVYGIDSGYIKKGIESYRGVKRRFDIRTNIKGSVYIDDYAHHPEEIRAFVKAVKMHFTNQKITGIFQPHLFSRTRDFMDEFAEVLGELDMVYVMDIYPAREKPLTGINSGVLLEKIRNTNKQHTTHENIIEIIKQNKPEVLVTMGAGDIDKLVGPLEEIMRP